MGFPSRVEYAEWKQRYAILNPNACPKGQFMEPKKACEKILGGITEIDSDSYRFGMTKLFFKAGIIGALEDLRDDTIAIKLSLLQTFCRAKLARDIFVKKINERNGSIILQRNWRKYQTLKNWPWQGLLFKIKPLLNSAEKRLEMDALLVEYDAMKKDLEKETKLRKQLEVGYQIIYNV